MRRCAKVDETSLRRRVCSGGSVVVRLFGIGFASATRGAPCLTTAARENLGSASTIRTSSYRVTNQTSAPANVRTRATGRFSRSSAKVGDGSNWNASLNGISSTGSDIPRP